MTTKALDYPPDAIRVIFQPLSGKRVRYRIWKRDGKYYWAAAGHSGKEDTQEAAMRAAREWIEFGIHGLVSHGRTGAHAGR